MSKEKIKVITIGNAPSVKGGITSVISQILSHDWTTQDVEMSFVSSFDGGNAFHKVITFTEGYAKIRKACRSHNVDVVHIHMSHNGSFTRKYLIHKLCKKYGVGNIIHLHSSEFVTFYETSSDLQKQKIRELLTNCDYVIALGNEWENRIKKIAPKAKIQIIKNTVHIPDECTNQNVDQLNFLYLGVLVERKGVIDLLKAIRRLYDDGILQDNKVIFNIGGTGECEKTLKNYVSDNKLEHYVNFLGWVSGDDKIKHLRSNQVLVLPSYNEGLPIAILEAISYGMPVIATEVGSVAEAVQDGKNGFLYQAGEIDKLSDALRKIIESPSLRKEMAIVSRKLAVESFGDEKYFATLATLYRNIIL